MSNESGRAMTKDELVRFFRDEFPQSEAEIVELGVARAVVRQRVGTKELRPGGTVSGPVLASLADAAMYAALLGEIGPVGLAVTTNLSIDFLRKPAADRDVVGECELVKVGRRLAVGRIVIRSDGLPEIVAVAAATYSIPPPHPEDPAP